MIRAFEPSYINEIRGCQSVKLAIPNAYGKDIHMMFDTAVRTGKVKTVILSLDAFAYA